MKYIFCSMMYSDPETDIITTDKPKSISGHKFQYNLAKGLMENGAELLIYNIQRISTYPRSSKVLIKREPFSIENEDVGFNISFVNLPFINYITQYYSLRKSLKAYIREHNNEKIALLVFNTHYIQSKLALSLKSESIIACNVIGDLYGEYGIENKNTGLRGGVQRYIEKKQEKYQDKFDKYVLLAPLMKEALSISDNDSVVVEGFFDCNNIMRKDDSKSIVQSAKTITYAGSLKLVYGIKHLLDAFELIADEEYTLYIAGQGDGEELVKEYAAKDLRIKYLGFITPDKVKDIQSKSTVLISPRLSDEKFVKYSFPSKTLECLASGKPYIAHRLPCDPKEYENYIQYPEDESDIALRNKIVEICELSREQRDAIGTKSRDFVNREKNTKTMCKRIIDMLEPF